MNWLFGKSRSNLPEPTALQTQKSKQIEQLKTFNQNVTEIHRDVEYRVNFLVNGRPTSLHITLPPQFPQDKPQVKVSPPLRHPWVNDQMVVSGSPELNSFMMHSDLGKIIRHIVEEFQKTPPVFLPTNQQPAFGGMAAPPPYPLHPPGGMPGQPPAPGYPPYSQPPVPAPIPAPAPAPQTYMPGVPLPTLPPVAQQVPTTSYQQHQAPPVSTASGGGGGGGAACMVAPAVVPPAAVSATAAFHPPASSVLNQDLNTQMSLHSIPARNYQTPELPPTFSQLNDLSNAELRGLSEDEDRLLQLVMELPQLSKIASDRQQICEKNELLAKENVLKKPMLEEKKRILLEKYDELNDLRRVFEESSEKQDSLRGAYDPKTLQINLKVAAQKADEEAEAIAEQFIDGSISVQEFSKQYLQKKTLGHLRKAKEEKLSQYIFQSRPF